VILLESFAGRGRCVNSKNGSKSCLLKANIEATRPAKKAHHWKKRFAVPAPSLCHQLHATSFI
jgi:hypothetical protein